MELNVLEFEQKGTKSFMTKIKCSEIENNGQERLSVDQKSADNPNGYQRPDSPSRWKAFGNFMESVNGFCPVPLVGNIRTDGKNAHKLVLNNGKISIPDNIRIYICEGQHRLKGYQYLLNEYNIDVDIPLVIINEPRDKEVINFHYINDSSYKIVNVKGIILMENRFEECNSKKLEISKEIETSIKLNEKESRSYINSVDKSGKSKIDKIIYKVDGGNIEVSCWKWSKEIKDARPWRDTLQVSIRTNTFNEWLKYEAYN